MARPPSGTDRKLKEAGRRLLQEGGLAGFSVRGACRLAGVNTGMFHYYFGSKEEFLEAVLKEVYADFMQDFKAGVESAGSPRERLKAALIEVGKFALGLRRTAPLLFADMAYGNAEAFDFFRNNFTEHVRQVAVLAAGSRPASRLKAHSLPFMIGALLPVMVFPVLMAGLLERNGVRSLAGVKSGELLREFFSDEGIAERAEIALRGIGL